MDREQMGVENPFIKKPDRLSPLPSEAKKVVLEQDVAGMERIIQEAAVEADLDKAAAKRLAQEIKSGNLDKTIKPDLESDPTLTFFSRINNPAIQEQMVDLLLKNEEYKETEERIAWEVEKDEDGNPLEGRYVYETDEYGELITKGGVLIRKKAGMVRRFPNYVKKTREQLLQEIQARVKSVTQLGGEKNVVYLYSSWEADKDKRRKKKEEEELSLRPKKWSWRSIFQFLKKSSEDKSLPTEAPITSISDIPERTVEAYYNEQEDEVLISDKIAAEYNKDKFTAAQLAGILAHEKGHQIRKYGQETYLNNTLCGILDLENFELTLEEFEHFPVRTMPSKLTLTKGSEQVKEYFDANEILERMSQLKNYFGFKGNEVFTKGHLKYARVHYVDDTDFDNAMGVFLRAITPAKEGQFIEAMNTFGV